MWRSRLASIIVLALAGCGGGGGSSDRAQVESLVPAAQPLGAVLVDNAADLRPIRDGARWQYHGTSRPDGVTVRTYYTASVQQRASTSGGIQESGTDVLLGSGDTTTVEYSGGAVKVRTTDPFGTGSTEVVTYVELRSPVRINDQYTTIERSNVPLGGDVDGDGKPDVADVAIYTVVVGAESVTLRELSRAINAVRLDTTIVVRTKKSSDGAFLPPRRVVESDWYASGVGVVRRTLTLASTSGTGPVEKDETLFSWDGVSDGLGAVGPIPAILPSGTSAGAGFALLPRPRAAATVGDMALVIAGTLRATDPTSMTVGVFDKRGQLQTVREYPGLIVDPGNFSPTLLSIDGQTAVLATSVARNAFGFFDLQLRRLDAAGNLQGTAVTIEKGAESGFVVAWDGSALWLGWRSMSTLLVQPYSLDGAALAAPQTLDSQGQSQIGALLMSASAGRLLATWVRVDLLKASYRYAVLQGAGDVADVRTLGVGDLPNGFASDRFLVPVLGSNIAALQWKGPIFSFSDPGPLPESQLRAVSLDASWNPRRSTAGTLDDERLPSNWAGQTFATVSGARGDRLVVSGFMTQVKIPELFSTSDFVTASFVQPGATPLATAAATAPTLSNISGTSTNADQFGQPYHLLLWDDRALVIGDNYDRTMVSVFWFR